MAAWFLETGIYLLGLALIPAVGLLLVAWGLWGDRSKGRTRCPKCWYDMRGTVPKLECPECGHDAGQERRLRKHRRRWGRTAVGVVLVLLSSYLLILVAGWYREQPTIQDFTKRGHRVLTGPKWSVGWLPHGFAQFFDRVQAIWFLPTVTDSDMAKCRKLRQLWRLSVERAKLTETGFVHISAMPLSCHGFQVESKWVVL